MHLYIKQNKCSPHFIDTYFINTTRQTANYVTLHQEAHSTLEKFFQNSEQMLYILFTISAHSLVHFKYNLHTDYLHAPRRKSQIFISRLPDTALLEPFRNLAQDTLPLCPVSECYNKKLLIVDMPF